MRLTNAMKEIGITKIYASHPSHYFDGVTQCLCEITLQEDHPIEVEKSYQRSHDEKHSSKISNGCCVDIPPVLSFRDEILFAVDGQHRSHGARKAGCKIVWATVFFNMTVQQEAEMYHFLNQSKRPNKWNHFKAGRMAGIDKYCKIHATVESFGLTLMPGGDLRHPANLEKAYDSNVLDQFLTLISAFKVGERLPKEVSVAATEFQNALISLLKTHGARIANSKVVRALRNEGIDEIFKLAKSYCPCGDVKQSAYKTAMENMLRDLSLLPTYHRRAA